MSIYPKSVPLHHSAISKIRDIDCVDLDLVFQNANRQLLETFSQLIESPSTKSTQEQIEKVLQSYQQIAGIQSESRSLSATLKKVKNDYVEESGQYEPVSLENWSSYHELPKPPSLYEMFEKATPTESAIELSNDDKILKSLPYIWKDPTSIIPDQISASTEDDLQIEGGKIELVCPITLKPFENPMISKKCNHVFDKEGLIIYFTDARDCPEGGCSQKLTMADFVPDNLMKLRCRIAQFQRGFNLSSSTSQTNIDII